jgi:nitroreductase
MDFDTVINTRRSIRKYQDKKVERKYIEEMIESAIMAPSWKNSQTARYHIIEKEEMLTKVKADCLPTFNAENVKDAPVLIVTSFLKDCSGYDKSGSPSNELENHWGSYDLGLHNQNLILKATELGLGTLILGIRQEETLRMLLNIPKEEIIVSVIAVGYPDISPKAPKRYQVSEITKFY